MTTADPRSYVSLPQLAMLLGVSDSRVRQLIQRGRIVGARKVGRDWIIPLEGGRAVFVPSKSHRKGIAG